MPLEVASGCCRTSPETAAFFSTLLRRMAACSKVQALRTIFTANTPPLDGGKGGACWFIRAKAAAQRLAIMLGEDATK